jgi:regulator of vacuolar morphogenesis
MIQTLRDERDALTRVLALPSKPAAQERTAFLSSATEQAQASSLSTSSSSLLASSPPQKPTRKFGSSSRLDETALTRPLDNESLLQLQRQAMDSQDSEVDALLAIVRRQKEVGSAIGDELETQNRLLEELELGIDRTRAGVKSVDKRLDKVTGK